MIVKFWLWKLPQRLEGGHIEGLLMLGMLNWWTQWLWVGINSALLRMHLCWGKIFILHLSVIKLVLQCCWYWWTRERKASFVALKFAVDQKHKVVWNVNVEDVGIWNVCALGKFLEQVAVDWKQSLSEAIPSYLLEELLSMELHISWCWEKKKKTDGDQEWIWLTNCVLVAKTLWWILNLEYSQMVSSWASACSMAWMGMEQVRST